MRSRFPGLGLFITLLALACQLAVGATIQPAGGALARPLAQSGIICHGDGAGGGVPIAPTRPGRNCQLCPLCTTFTTPAPTLVGVPSIPAPARAGGAFAAPLPISAAHAVARLLSASPRGPPARA
ncbi:MAG TPA: hypothetical protein VFE41_34345 [Acetobacteraceae bacterium]|nr:hypothetical protein [Acetobacteraceae bacterium]